MLTLFADYYAQASKWSNDNQGVVSLGIFIATIAFGWASGIFSALRRKPKFRFSLIDGPTFCCTFPVGKEHADHEVHRTGIALYLAISNIGSAASSIENVSVGYHWHLHPFTRQWFRYSLGCPFSSQSGKKGAVFGFADGGLKGYSRRSRCGGSPVPLTRYARQRGELNRAGSGLPLSQPHQGRI